MSFTPEAESSMCDISRSCAQLLERPISKVGRRLEALEPFLPGRILLEEMISERPSEPVRDLLNQTRHIVPSPSVEFLEPNPFSLECCRSKEPEQILRPSPKRPWTYPCHGEQSLLQTPPSLLRSTEDLRSLDCLNWDQEISKPDVFGSMETPVVASQDLPITWHQPRSLTGRAESTSGLMDTAQLSIPMSSSMTSGQTCANSLSCYALRIDTLVSLRTKVATTLSELNASSSLPPNLLRRPGRLSQMKIWSSLREELYQFAISCLMVGDYTSGWSEVEMLLNYKRCLNGLNRLATWTKPRNRNSCAGKKRDLAGDPVQLDSTPVESTTSAISMDSELSSDDGEASPFPQRQPEDEADWEVYRANYPVLP